MTYQLPPAYINAAEIRKRERDARIIRFFTGVFECIGLACLFLLMFALFYIFTGGN